MLKIRHQARGLVCLFCLCVYGLGRGQAHAATYYVNDTNLAGDVYCSVVGNTTNSGTNAASPKATLQEIIDAFTLTGGDIVYIDTGIYTDSAAFYSEGGSAGSYLLIQGSTNYSAGGSVINSGGGVVIYMYASSYIAFSDLTISGGSDGFGSRFAGYIHSTRIVFRENTIGARDEASGGWRFDECLFINNSSRGAQANVDWAWKNCVFYNNPTHIYVPYSMAIITNENCVFVNGTTFGGVSAYQIKGDYNVFWNTSIGFAYSYLSDLNQPHSTWANPDFSNPTNFDFHEKSVVGRWTRTAWVTDTVHSILIDLGDPAHVYTNETFPHGSNINVGLYGNTKDASKSRTNTWLFARSFNDGGDITGTGKLYWAYGSFTNGLSVRLDYSVDGGTNWITITNNLPVTYGSSGFVWNVSAITSTPLALWRVISTNSGAADTNNSYFTLRGTGQIKCYVNDTGTVGDIYCSAVGSINNTGLSSNSPLPGIQDVLDRYNLGPDDMVCVDTGYYVLTNTITVGMSDRGVMGHPLVIAGSTNSAAGGTVLNRQNTGSDVIDFSSVEYVVLRDLTLRGGARGVRLISANNNQLENVISRNNMVGFRGDTASTNRFLRCVAYINSTGFEGFTLGNEWINGVSWGNTIAFSPSAATAVTVSNSVIVGGTAFGGSGVTFGDYNIFWNTALGYTSMNEFQRAKGWWHSMFTDPFFVNPAQLDFHPQSVNGVYSNGTWVFYTNHSPCIDMGCPVSIYTNEPPPNGSNINIGVYGNTTEASKSRTNEWLQVMNFNDGGTLDATSGSDVVYWNAGNYPPGATVRIELSRASGSNGTWEVVITGLLASAGSYTWINTNYSSSAFARWRVVYEFNTNVYSATTHTNFLYHNGRYEYYINDSSTQGDVYCTAPGDDANLGTSPGSPRKTLKSVLDDYDVIPGDIIYIDTGYYTITTPFTITDADGGVSNVYVYIQGSTNVTGQGTVLNGNGKAYYPLHFNGASYMDVRDITVTNAAAGIRMVGSVSNRVERVVVYNSSFGIELSSAFGIS